MLDIVIDMDNTLINTVGAFTQINNERYDEDVDLDKVRSYGFRELSLTDDEITDIFASDELWEHMEWYHGAVEAIEYLNERYHVVLSTRGGSENIKHKIDFIRKTFPEIGIIPIVIKDSPSLSLDKDLIRTRVLIDDNPKVLRHVGANTYPVCMRIKDWDWNKDYTGIKAYNYYELVKKVDKLIDEHDNLILEKANYVLYDGKQF